MKDFLNNEIVIWLLLVSMATYILIFIHAIILFVSDTAKFIGRLKSTEKRLLVSGLFFYAAIPLLKDHPYGNSYLAQVIIPIYTKIAEGLCIAVILSFFKSEEKHSVSGANQGSN